jgi:putative transposase
LKELKKRLVERALGAELSEHLGYEKGDPAGRGGGNSRKGYSSKTVIGDDGAIEIAVPRDRNGSFEPQIVAKEPAPAKAGGRPGSTGSRIGSSAFMPEACRFALRVKIGDEGLVRNKAAYVALALNSEGEKEVLGLWIEQTEGAKFWLKAMNELKTRGVNDVLIAVVDRLKACPREGGGLCRGDRHGLSADHGADPGSGSGAGSASFI